MDKQTDPGIHASPGIDRPLIVAAIFVFIGYTPVSWYTRLLGYGYFGPIAWPAILGMVGVLFGVIALLRSLDLEDKRLRNAALVILALGMIRLFIAPIWLEG